MNLDHVEPSYRYAVACEIEDALERQAERQAEGEASAIVKAALLHLANQWGAFAETLTTPMQVQRAQGVDSLIRLAARPEDLAMIKPRVQAATARYSVNKLRSLAKLRDAAKRHDRDAARDAHGQLLWLYGMSARDMLTEVKKELPDFTHEDLERLVAR